MAYEALEIRADRPLGGARCKWVKLMRKIIVLITGIGILQVFSSFTYVHVYPLFNLLQRNKIIKTIDLKKVKIKMFFYCCPYCSKSSFKNVSKTRD